MNLRSALLMMGAGALVFQGCYMVMQPGPVTNFLTGGDEKLADAIRRAAAKWAIRGLEVASYVTVDDGRAGLPVRFATPAEIRAACPDARAVNLSGCTYWAMGDWLEMLISESFRDQPDDLEYMVAHEMIHALVPEAPHNPEPGIFTESRTLDYVTLADMQHLSRYTRVNVPEVPFDNDPASTV